MEGLTIGQVAKQTEVGIETIRFYERQGLIDEPPRRESGYRQYPEDVVKRLYFIKRAISSPFHRVAVDTLRIRKLGYRQVTQVTLYLHSPYLQLGTQLIGLHLTRKECD